MSPPTAHSPGPVCRENDTSRPLSQISPCRGPEAGRPPILFQIKHLSWAILLLLLGPLWKKGWEAGGGTAAEDNSSQSLGSWCLWVTKSVPRALLGRELTHLLLFTHILRTRSFCYCRPPPPPHWVPQVVEGHLCSSSGEHPGSIWEHRAESELQSDSTRLRRTWRPLQASRVARTVLQQAGTAGGGPPLPI